jgi:hypothetical protein
MDTLEGFLETADGRLSEFLDKNSLRPRFAALADLCLNREEGVFATVLPTTALTATSGLPERLELAERFHIHTILTYMGTTDVNLSQGTHREMNESIVVMRRQPAGNHPATRIISLDRFPRDATETDRLFDALTATGASGPLADGWGEASAWPTERIQAGDWSAVAWRSPRLADAAAEFAQHDALAEMQRQRERERESESTRPDRRSAPAISEQSGDGDRACHSSDALRRLPQGWKPASRDDELAVHATGQTMRDDYNKQPASGSEPFPVLQSKGADGQQRIEAEPDAWWEWKRPGKPPILAKAGHLLVTMGQGTTTARLVAVASDERYVGQGWMPVTGLDATEAKAVSVFLNSTAGRLLIMRHPGKRLGFPFYNPAAWRSVAIPDLSNPRIFKPLAACWAATRKEVVPQFRDGYTSIRRRWDEAVCATLGWDISEIAQLGELLAREPYVRGVAYGQWRAEPLTA